MSAATKDQAAKLAGADGADGVRYVVRVGGQKVRRVRGVPSWNDLQVYWRFNDRAGAQGACGYLGPVQPEAGRTVAQVKVLGNMRGIYTGYTGNRDEAAQAWTAAAG